GPRQLTSRNRLRARRGACRYHEDNGREGGNSCQQAHGRYSSESFALGCCMVDPDGGLWWASAVIANYRAVSKWRLCPVTVGIFAEACAFGSCFRMARAACRKSSALSCAFGGPTFAGMPVRNS